MTTEIERRLTRASEREVLQQLLEAQQLFHASTSEAIERLNRRVHNTVLLNELIPFTSTGIIRRHFGVPIGSALLINFTSVDVTVAGGPAQDVAPTRGIGVNLVPAGTWQSFPVGNSDIAIYGSASAGNVTLQAFTGMLAFGSGAIR